MMKIIEWDYDKNEWLKENRDVCFEDVLVAMNEAGYLDTIPNPSRHHRGQRMLVVLIRGYIHTVPFAEDEHRVFLKTIIPNRKVAKKYLIDDKQ